MTQDDVDTARRLLVMHQPVAPDANGRSVCASATHLSAMGWPCPRYRWAAAVLAALDRGEII